MSELILDWVTVFFFLSIALVVGSFAIVFGSHKASDVTGMVMLLIGGIMALVLGIVAPLYGSLLFTDFVRSFFSQGIGILLSAFVFTALSILKRIDVRASLKLVIGVILISTIFLFAAVWTAPP